MSVNVHLLGEGIEFEREVSERKALEIMELSISDGEGVSDVMEGVEAEEDREEEETALPGDFFNRLSPRQKAMIQVLLEADGQLSSTELRRRMEEDYGESVGGGRGLAGILAGFTRKYGEDFNVVKMTGLGDGEGLYELNPDRPDYVEELREYFQS